MSVSINKLRNRSVSSTTEMNETLNRYIEDYQIYFNNALNKTKYQDKYNSEIAGECIILDVSEYNQKNGDEKWITTFPNSNIELLSVISLDFGKEITSYWIVEDKEELTVKSHCKFKVSPLYHLGKLQRYGIDDVEIDTKVMDSDNDTTKKKIYFSPKVFNIQRGDLLVYNDAGKIYLVKEVQNFTSYPFANSEECNHLLKWMINGKLYESQCIVVKSTRFTLGDKVVNAGIIEGDSVYSIELPYNDDTKTIHDNQRFIINDEAWRTTKTDFTTVNGLLTLFLSESSINTQVDDLDNEIADAWSDQYTITLNSTVKHKVQIQSPSQLYATVS